MTGDRLGSPQLRHGPTRGAPLANIALFCLLAGPCLGSKFALGGLTLDNWLTFAGAGLIVLLGAIRGQIPAARLSILPATLAFAITLSGLANGTPFLQAVIRYVAIATVPYAIMSLGVSTKAIHRIAGIVVGIGALSVLIQPWTSIVPPYVDPDTGVIRFGGLFGHPNFAACVMGLTLLYVLARGARSVWSWGVILSLAALMFLTGSLGALAATAVSAGLLLVRRPLVLIAVACATFVFYVTAGTVLSTRIDFLTGSGSQQNSLTWRADRWAAALHLAPSPNIFGIGWEEVAAAVGGPAHSTFIAVYVELGLVGSILLLVALAVTASVQNRTAFGLVALAFIVLSSITDPVAYYPSTMTMWLALSALALRERRHGLDHGNHRSIPIAYSYRAITSHRSS